MQKSFNFIEKFFLQEYYYFLSFDLQIDFCSHHTLNFKESIMLISNMKFHQMETQSDSMQFDLLNLEINSNSILIIGFQIDFKEFFILRIK